ncbi:MAG: hypothetical protein R3F43_14030 [bacterium]
MRLAWLLLGPSRAARPPGGRRPGRLAFDARPPTDGHPDAQDTDLAVDFDLAPADFGPPLDAGTPVGTRRSPSTPRPPIPTPRRAARGTACNPIVIDRLPFTDDGAPAMRPQRLEPLRLRARHR